MIGKPEGWKTLWRCWGVYLVQVVILPNQFFQLRLHVDDSLCREFELDDRNPGILQVLQEAHF
jgi:hypothetical protein